MSFSYGVRGEALKANKRFDRARTLRRPQRQQAELTSHLVILQGVPVAPIPGAQGSVHTM